MSFVPEPGVRYDMPATFGPSVAPPIEEDFEVYGVSISYLTQPEAIGAFLPHWFETSAEPILSVGYTRMIGMAWMGGRSYNITSVYVSAVCTAGQDRVSGRYTLAIWESDCAPVVSGREYMGSPKRFATIPYVDVTVPDFRFTCSEYDALLIRGTVANAAPVSAQELAALTEAGRNTMVLNWKYIAGVGDVPDADYPTALYMSLPFDAAWRGEGHVEFCTPSTQEAPYSAHVVRALAGLPLLENRGALVTHARSAKLYRERTRRLDV